MIFSSTPAEELPSQAHHLAVQHAKTHDFQTPLDEVDAAARILDPVFAGLATGEPQFGVFLKDYAPCEW